MTIFDPKEIEAVFNELGTAIDKANELDPALELGGLEPTIHKVTLCFHHPVLWARVLMENLMDQMDSSPDTFSEREKMFWTKIATEMGPDWIGKFRRVGAFMNAVDKA